MNNKPICFFDSGIGGSTILKEVIKLLPNENYVYYADSKNNPYGNKTKEELFEIVSNAVDNLLKYDPKLIVCACNTATEVVLNDIRKKYPSITFVGTEPAVKVVHDKYQDKKTLVITTKGTGESERFKSLFNNYKTPNCTLVEAPLLAGLIENNKDPYPYLKELLKDYKDIDIVVLGCTHFPLAKNALRKVLGNVTFVDGSVGIANRVKNLLKDNLNDNSGSINIISTKEDVSEIILKIINKNKNH